MDRYAIIESGKVANVAVAEPDFAAEQGWVSCPSDVGPGWGWNGANFTPPPPPPADAQWAEVRIQRNKLLAACDWTQLSDAPVNAAAWAVYRQELRDITQQSDPFNITWPQEPEA